MTKARWNDVQFVNCELTVEEKAICKGWLTDYGEFDDQLSKLLEGSYRVSIKHDVKFGPYSAFIQPVAQDSVNAGLCLSGRGSTAGKAVKQAMFKHYVVFDEACPRRAKEPAGFEIDD